MFQRQLGKSDARLLSLSEDQANQTRPYLGQAALFESRDGQS
jgi:hypothetical protein